MNCYNVPSEGVGTSWRCNLYRRANEGQFVGMAITGTLGLLMGVIVLASGRNLWPVIIGHGLYDASRFVLFYFQGPPAG